MKISWGESFSQLEISLQSLKNSVPSLPVNYVYGGQPFTLEDIIQSFERLIKQLELVTVTDVDSALSLIHSPNVIAQIPNLVSSVNNFISSSGAAPYSDQLLSQIWSTYNSLSWILPYGYPLNHYLSLLTKNDKSKLAELERINGLLEQAYKNISSYQNNLNEAKSHADQVVSQIEKDGLEASNAKTNAESNALQSATSKDRFDQLIAAVSEGKKDIDDILVKINEIKDKAEQTLASTSQVALADSFKNRKTSLESSQTIWIKAFCFGLFCLFSFTVISIAYSDFYHLPAIVRNGGFDAWGALLRLLLASPIIWFTWFAVRQYGNNVALIEDYAFKEASALAFVGYKKDMQDDIDMVKLLRESAIRNFSYPPSRLISSSEASSPMQELFEKAFQDKGAFDKLISMLKAMKGK
jgi:hypothetical protein